jgi:predicted acetyltransferase
VLPEPLTLVAPSRTYLDGFAAALRKGWSPQTTRDVSGEMLAEIEADADRFLVDLTAADGVFKLTNGQTVPRLPMVLRWLWDGEFCGTINLRWQTGTNALPPHVSGHIGYSVVPWKRGNGYATEALRLMLVEARMVGLSHVELTTDVDNDASQRVILRCGGVFTGIRPADAWHDRRKRMYAIDLSARVP